MKKIGAIISGTMVTLLAVAPAFAQNVNICPQGTVFFKLCNLSSAKFTDAVGALLTLILIIAVIIAIFFLIYGGIKWILSGGDKTAVESARNHIVAAVVGLIIALAAYFILNIVLGFFGINVTTFELPTLGI